MEQKLIRYPGDRKAMPRVSSSIDLVCDSYYISSSTTDKGTDSSEMEFISKTVPVKFIFGSIITIIVGIAEQKFSVHKTLLYSKSGYFEKECKDDASKIIISHQDASVFQYFVYWLYTQRLLGYYNNGLSPAAVAEIRNARASADRLWRHEHTAENWKNACQARKEEGIALIRCYPLEQLVALYILAEELQVHGLKDKIITAIVAIYADNLNASTAYWTFDWGSTDKAGPVAAVNLAYKKLRGASVLKRLLVLIYVTSVRLDSKDVRNQFDTEFLCDALAEFRGLCHGVRSGLTIGDMSRWQEKILRMLPAWGQEIYEGIKAVSIKDAMQPSPLGIRQWFFPLTANF